VADVAALAPDLKGKISTYDAAANPFGLSLFWTWARDRSELWSLIEKIGPSARPERSAGTIRDKVLSGEYGVGLFLSGVNIPRLSRRMSRSWSAGPFPPMARRSCCADWR
jgi:iron(III) transport system substrate-binding protein